MYKFSVSCNLPVKIMVVHCVTPLDQLATHLIMDAVAKVARGMHKWLILIPGGNADLIRGYVTGNHPVNTAHVLKEYMCQLLEAKKLNDQSSLPVMPDVVALTDERSDCKIVDTSSEARRVFEYLQNKFVFVGKRNFSLIIPANGLHGRRITRSYKVLAERMDMRVDVSIDKIPNAMGLKWTVLELLVRQSLWLLDPLCERFPNNRVLAQRRRDTAGIDHETALANSKSYGKELYRRATDSQEPPTDPGKVNDD